jgi:hypothetical protein
MKGAMKSVNVNKGKYYKRVMEHMIELLKALSPRALSIINGARINWIVKNKRVD